MKILHISTYDIEGGLSGKLSSGAIIAKIVAP